MMITPQLLHLIAHGAGFYTPPMPTQYFEPLYSLVIPVAEEFMVLDQNDFAERYHELIRQYWQASACKE